MIVAKLIFKLVTDFKYLWTNIINSCIAVWTTNIYWEYLLRTKALCLGKVDKVTTSVYEIQSTLVTWVLFGARFDIRDT